MLMWDWEIANYLEAEGVKTIAPYNLEQTKMICQALAVKRELQDTKFLVFQDNPGEGFQAEIFKRFYWWEDECTQRMMTKFGITLVKKSFRDLAAEAKAIPKSEAHTWQRPAYSLMEFKNSILSFVPFIFSSVLLFIILFNPY